MGMGTITAALVKSASKPIAEDLYSTFKAIAKSTASFTAVTLEIGFDGYINNSIKRCSNVKTIVNRHSTIDIRDIYVDANLILNDDKFPEDEILLNDKIKNVIVTGTAGSGKSLLMKMLFLKMVQFNIGVIPVFIELRHLNDEKDHQMLNLIVDSFEPHIPGFSKAWLDQMLKMGKVALLLDGFDELYEAAQKSVSKQIDSIIYKYPDVRVVVSGRPDPAFVSWSHFDEYKISPLEKEDCILTVDRINFDSEIKEKFIKSIEEKLFETHKEYLENPLMVSVMLITFDQFVDMPEDMSAFYAKALEVLYSGHDLTKSFSFRRETQCNLSFRELESVLGYFCALSFVNRDYDYSENEAIDYLNESISLSKVKAYSSGLIVDLNKAYCLLIRDGTRYAYIHRSFQEYLSAVCLSKSERINYMNYHNKIISSSGFERYIRLLKEISREKLEEKYTIPMLEIYDKKIFSIRKTAPKKFLSFHVDAYGIDSDGGCDYVMRSPLDDGVSWWQFVETFTRIVDERLSGKWVFSVKEDISLVQPYARKVEDHESFASLEIHIKEFKAEALKKSKIYIHYLERSEKLHKGLQSIKENIVKEKMSTNFSPRRRRLS